MGVESCYGSGMSTQPSTQAVARDLNRVLVVDDEAPVRKLFKMILGQDMPTLAVDEACNGLEALRVFREHHHAVVALDLRMPLLDGLETFNSLQKICWEDHCLMPAVVFCTGFIPSETMSELISKSAGCQMLQKPIRSAQIVKAIKAGLQVVIQQGA